jgi:hypothetical protein
LSNFSGGKLLSSSLLSKNTKIKKYRTVIMPRDVGLRVFDSRVLRKTFGPKRDEVRVEW